MENEQNKRFLNGDFANTTEIGSTMPAAASTFETGGYFMEKIIKNLHIIYHGLVPKVKIWWNERRIKKHQQNKIEREEETKPIRDEKHVLIPVEASVF